MNNIKTDVKEHLLTILVDLREEQGKSKSGKSIIVASSRGIIPVSDGENVFFINLNVYKK